MRNSTAVLLTIVGGVFYVIGGVLVISLAGSLSSLGGLGDCPASLCGSAFSVSSSGLNGLVYAIGGFGIVAGVLIIFGGFLMQSAIPGRRKMGSILSLVMMFIGALPALGGLLIGFILTAIGGYMGLTYKATRSNIKVGLGPVGSVTLGPQTEPSEGDSAGHGPLNYCIKCGSKLRQGAIFCGACGARVPD